MQAVSTGTEPDKLQWLPCDVVFAVTERFSEINAPVLRKN